MSYGARGHIDMMSDADAAAPIGCPKTDERGQQMYKYGDCKKKRTADAAQPHFPEHAKRQAVQTRVDGASLSAAARMVGASVPAVSGCAHHARNER